MSAHSVSFTIREPGGPSAYNSLIFDSSIHGYIALTTVPNVLSELSRAQDSVYCCAECKCESKKRYGKGDDDDEGEDNERILLLQRQDPGQGF